MFNRFFIILLRGIQIILYKRDFFRGGFLFIWFKLNFFQKNVFAHKTGRSKRKKSGGFFPAAFAYYYMVWLKITGRT
ncbi:hypothetical protein BC343_29195 [Mucilaginibacter pedocola]|uniref:Uncharacterized protein n=1 Tax=Mucilaginibacter pedocola TaxID=1792845 RepID=A0A1S9PDR3_9SPHI|nr:hypothetical protein BC343_29195 [Mucilaginibacter pedocola]